MYALQAAGIPAAKVAKPEDVLHNPQLGYRRHYVALPHPSMGVVEFEMPAVRFRDREIVAERCPLMGEHTGDVLQAVGYSADEIADLFAAGVLN